MANNKERTHRTGTRIQGTIQVWTISTVQAKVEGPPQRLRNHRDRVIYIRDLIVYLIFDHPQLHLEKLVWRAQFKRGILYPEQLLEMTPVQNWGGQQSSEVTVVPQMMPPCALQTFLQELGQTWWLMLSFIPMQPVPPYQVDLQPPAQHSGNVLPQSIPPIIMQH